MGKPLVTVLVDTYNYGCFIEEAIESALAQEFPAEDMEIVVVDDGSTDDTQQRVRKFSERIRYFYKPNGGQASALNLGFEQASGEIIALLDADDVWFPNKVRRVVEALEKNPEAGMAYHRLWMWDADRGTSKEDYFASVSGFLPSNLKDILSYTITATSGLVFRRKFIAELHPIPEELTIQADAYLSALVIFLGPVVAVPEFLARYRIHGKNLYHSDSDQLQAERIRRRMATRRAMVATLENWLTARRYDLGQPEISAYFKQWKLAQERDLFQLEAPGRVEFFKHLWELPTTYGIVMSGRHRALSYAEAFAGLLLGYRHFPLFRKAYQRYRNLRSLWEAKFPPDRRQRSAHSLPAN